MGRSALHLRCRTWRRCSSEQRSTCPCAAQRRAQLNPQVRSIAATAAHARGLTDHNRKDLAEAVALYEGGSRPLAYAAALEDQGVATVDEGDTDEAVEVLGQALETYAQAGAAWDAGRVRGRLRALGVRRRLVAVQRPARGWAAMTDPELAVARVVAQGLTNREVAERLFVSQHTVSGHLRHVFSKLDVNTVLLVAWRRACCPSAPSGPRMGRAPSRGLYRARKRGGRVL
jgi:DNA-binding CsgD family transcriptional regulator